MKTIIILILSTFLVMSFSQTPARYEYLTMTQSTYWLIINKSDGFYEAIRVSKEKTKSFSSRDFTPLLTRIEGFEREGYELVTNIVYSGDDNTEKENYVMMRRRK